MRLSTAAILQEFARERARQAALTRDELEQEYRALQDSGYEISRLFTFQSNLAGSRQIEYHYELLLEDWKRTKETQLDMEFSFEKRGNEAINFLFPLLDKKDAFESVHIAYLLANMISKRKPWEQNYEKLVPYLLRYASLSSTALRRKAIIALGWCYAPSHFQEQIDCLSTHLLNDEDSLCRAWSASAFMWMFFHHAPLENVRQQALPVLLQSLERERNVFVVGGVVLTIQELWKKKLRLSQAAADRCDYEAIEKARKRALKFLNQLNEMQVH